MARATIRGVVGDERGLTVLLSCSSGPAFVIVEADHQVLGCLGLSSVSQKTRKASSRSAFDIRTALQQAADWCCLDIVESRSGWWPLPDCACLGGVSSSLANHPLLLQSPSPQSLLTTTQPPPSSAPSLFHVDTASPAELVIPIPSVLQKHTRLLQSLGIPRASTSGVAGSSRAFPDTSEFGTYAFHH